MVKPETTEKPVAKATRKSALRRETAAAVHADTEVVTAVAPVVETGATLNTATGTGADTAADTADEPVAGPAAKRPRKTNTGTTSTTTSAATATKAQAAQAPATPATKSVAKTAAMAAAAGSPSLPKRRLDVREVTATDLRTIDPDQAAFLRLVFDPRLSHWLGMAFNADVRPASTERSAAVQLVVHLACPGGNVSIAFPAMLLPALAFAVEANPPRVTPIATLVAARLMAPIMARFAAAARKLGDQRWQALALTAVETRDNQSGRAQHAMASFDLSMAGRFQARIGVLSIDPACTNNLQDMISTLPVFHYPATRAWRVAGRLRLASRAWSVALLHSLEVGDVLLCKGAAELHAFNAQLSCGAPGGMHWRGQVRITQQKVTIMSEMQEHDGATEGPASLPLLAAGVAELEVPVHFEIESTALSIAQLSSLRPGYVIELAIPVAEAQIQVVSCGQLLGRGKLVVIGDCLGVQIESLVAGGA